MYYEEKVVNGVLCYRSGPRDEWTPFTAQQLTDRVVFGEKKAHTFDQARETLKHLALHPQERHARLLIEQTLAAMEGQP